MALRFPGRLIANVFWLQEEPSGQRSIEKLPHPAAELTG